MEKQENALYGLVRLVKSWIGRSSEPANVSRDFWMPDHSCHVCYDCDAQFTIINRRHHCRRCGRIFCGKCTSNFIPISYNGIESSNGEGDRVRVCNFCFKQWEQEIALVEKSNRGQISPTFSSTSLLSMKSTSTLTTTGPFSASGYQQGSHYSIDAPHQSASADKHSHNKLEEAAPQTEKEAINGSSNGNCSPEELCYFTNRTFDDEEEYGAYQYDCKSPDLENSDLYYDCGEIDSNSCFNSMSLDTIEVSEISKDESSPTYDTGYSCATSYDKLVDDAEPDSSECDASSSVYAVDSSSLEPVDFENNGLLWVPPDPEDQEDDRETLFGDDDCDEDSSGNLSRLRTSSFGSGACRGRDHTSDEQKKAMKGIVEGHFRALICQLLEVENICAGEEGDKSSWLEIVTSLSWEAANYLKPDTSKGGGMDPAGYVKVKCLVCGHPSESVIIRGVVCKKNVAHRRMTSRVERPRLLALGGALEYQRVTNLLSSIDTLLQQESDHLKMAVAKIVAQQPDILLVEKTVARYAQDLLLEKDISLVLNIKKPLLERIARCTGAQIVPSIDHLASQKLGFCGRFHVDKYIEHHESGDHMKKNLKNLMFFEDCPKPLGCTVLLKGSNVDELKKVKHVVQYGVFAAYHLALETSFLADEGASIPELTLKSPITVTLPDKPVVMDGSISAVLVGDDSQPYSSLMSTLMSNCSGPEGTDGFSHSSEIDRTQSSESSLCVGSTVDRHGFGLESDEMTCNSCIQFSSTMPNNNSSQQCATRGTSIISSDGHCGGCLYRFEQSADLAKSLPDNQEVEINGVTPNGIQIKPGITDSDKLESREKSYTGNKIGQQQLSSSVLNIETDQKLESISIKDDIVSSDHKSILVSISTRCVWKGTVCERSQLFRIKYYGNFDKPLGRFLRDHLLDQGYRCQSCDMPSEAHVHCYTHRQGSLTISVRKLLELPLPGERDGKIWMWHMCLLCPRINGFPVATRRVVMSDAAWGLSFGKFLELSFSNHAAASRVASCGHSLHRDCLRFYGFGKMVACFRYAPIAVNSVYLPPYKLTFVFKQMDWIQSDANEVSERARQLFDEILNALHQISDTFSLSGKVKHADTSNRIAQLERALEKEKAEFEDLLRKASRKEVLKLETPIDTLEINKLRRQLLIYSYLWDQRLAFLTRSDKNPHEFLVHVLQKDVSPRKSGDNHFAAQQHVSPNGCTEGSVKNIVAEAPKDKISTDGCHEQDMSNTTQIPDHDRIKANSEPSNISQQKLVGQKNPSLLTSNSVSEESVPLEPDLVTRRTLSDGQFPDMLDLSDAFDAKWTGKNTPEPVGSNTSSPKSSVEAAAKVSQVDTEELNGGDMGPSIASLLLNKLGDGKEDSSSWIGMPFLQFYRSFNKYWGNFKLDSFYEYSPSYISCMQELHRNGPRSLLPVGVNEIVVAVYDDEPTSIVSYALASREYHSKLSDEKLREGTETIAPVNDSRSSSLSEHADESSSEMSRKNSVPMDEGSLSLSTSKSSLAVDPLLFTKELHVKVEFTDDCPLGKMKFTVICYYAKHFDALRRICCPTEIDYIRSLNRCKKWGAQGGKSNVFFAKSLDDRFIVKQVTKTELESFIKFAPEYFKYLSESIESGSPTSLAKILGIYQITSRNLKGGKDTKIDVLVMENLLFERHVTRLYDLKGSARSRYNADANGVNKVLLDQNLIEAMPTSPIFVGNKAKRLLERAVWNDTSFLASIDVMDYSLLVGVDEERHELVLGIIDFMRQYTWDKHLETWVKASGILGGPKNVSPTVISPKQYKKRFRKAMAAYFLVVPDQWSLPTSFPDSSEAENNEEAQQVTSPGTLIHLT